MEKDLVHNFDSQSIPSTGNTFQEVHQAITDAHIGSTLFHTRDFQQGTLYKQYFQLRFDCCPFLGMRS